MNNISEKLSAVIIGACLCFMMFTPAHSKPVHKKQNSKINFRKISLEQAYKLAKKDNKLVFVDVYRSLSPNKEAMALKEKMFSDPKVISYFNEHFINIKMDMNSELGKAFTPHLQMLMYPTMIIFGPNDTQLANFNIMQFKKGPDALLKKVKKVTFEGQRLIASNNSKTNFVENPSWNDLLKKAKMQGKPVIVDFYTTWCRPCIQMDRKVFTQDKVASYYNGHFLMAKYDAEKGEGIDLRKKYKVWGYPSYVFVDATGKQVYRVEGYTEADSMLIKGKEAMDAFKNTTAESHYINFKKTEGKSWAAIKKEATQENKLIFFDGYTTWCGPCKQMDRVVFHVPEVVDYFDKHFVNARFDMEKGEGITLKKNYNVRAYPTYLFINPETGKVVHRVVGSSKEDKFLAQAHRALTSDKNLAAIKQKYQSGNRDPAFIQQYLAALNTAYMKDKQAGVASDFLKNQSRKNLISERNWDIFTHYFKDINSAVFEYVLDNRSAFKKKFGKKQVNDKIYNTILYGSNAYLVTGKDGKLTLDEKGFNRYLEKVDDWNPPHEKKLIQLAKIGNYERSFQWEKFADAVDKGLRMKDILTPVQLWNYALFTESKCDDQDVLLRAANWAQEGAKLDKTGNMELYCMKIQAKLLAKAGHKEEAQQILDNLPKKKKSKVNAKMMMPLTSKGG